MKISQRVSELFGRHEIMMDRWTDRWMDKVITTGPLLTSSGGALIKGSTSPLEHGMMPAGKHKELTHAMSRYHWNSLGLCEMHQKNFGEMSTDDGHKVYLREEEDRDEYGLVFCAQGHGECYLRMPTSLQQTTCNLNLLEGSSFQYHRPIDFCTNICT